MATEILETATAALKRPTTSYSALPELSKSFLLDPAQRSYRHQYANIYFVRLVELRPIVEQEAQERWKSVRGESNATYLSSYQYRAVGPQDIRATRSIRTELD